MKHVLCLISFSVFFAAGLSIANAADDAVKILTSSEVLDASSASDWRKLDVQNVMLMELEHGDVLFEFAPDFAPQHVVNVKTLLLQEYFDGLAIIRSQENYVAQWGDPQAEGKQPKSIGKAAAKLAGEYFRSPQGLKITPVTSRDAYAERVGFVKGFPVGYDESRAWLTHCYGMLGAGRGGPADSGNGAELYVVTGHSPRHLDRNVTLLGRVISGMQHLTTLARGTGALGFYQDPSEYVTIKSIRLGKDVPVDKLNIEVMKTNTETFGKFILSRTHRNEDWFLDPTGKIEICNIAVPTRAVTD